MPLVNFVLFMKVQYFSLLFDCNEHQTARQPYEEKDAKCNETNNQKDTQSRGP